MGGMRRLKRAMIVIATGEILSSASGVLADPPTPSLPPTSPMTLPSSGVGVTDRPSSQDSTNAAASPTAEAGQGSAANASEAGYSWRDKPARGKHHKPRSTKVNSNLAQAKGPEFIVAEDGTSHITIQLSRKVEFKAQSSQRRCIVELPNVQVAVGNDMNPLITTHFATPLEDARLIAEKKGARLVIDLRENVTPQVSMKDVSGGASVLEVILPKSLHQTAVVTDAGQRKGHIRMRSAKRPGSSSRDKSETPQNGGIGPRL